MEDRLTSLILQLFSSAWAQIAALWSRFPIRGQDIATATWAGTSDLADVGGTEATGSAATIPRGDHKHALDFSSGTVQDINASTANGSSTYAARADHTHKIPSGYVTSAMITDGTIVDGDISSSAAIGRAKIAPIGGRVYHNTTQTANNGSATNWMQFNSSRRLDGITQATGNATNSRLVAPSDGWYEIKFQMMWPADTTGTLRRLGIYFNNTTTIESVDDGPPSGSNVKKQTASTVYYLTASQYVEAFCVHDATSNLTIASSANYSPEFSMARVG